MQSKVSDAWLDLRNGLRMWRIWMAFAKEDIGEQHKRTTLGPLWLLVNYLASAGTFIFLFDRGHGTANYPAHVAIGLMVWFFIMEALTQGVNLFSREESFIKGTSLPLTIYIMRLTLQCAIRGGYAMIGCLAILIATGTPFSLSSGWSIVGIAIVLATAPAAITLVALLGAYIPDSQFLVSNAMRIGMFLTPVFWTHEASGGARAFFYYWNPFTYFLEIVRQPVVNGEPAWEALWISLSMCVGIWAFAIFFFTRLRREVVFVL